MVDIKPKTTIKMSLSGNCDGHSRSRISVRGVTSSIDEPVERGNTNEGLTPTETLMASRIGCTNVISNKIAHKMRIGIAHRDIDLGADVDRRGVTLTEKVDAPFSNVVRDIDVITDATAEQLKLLKTDLQKFCPIAKVLRGPGITITENWTRIPL